MRQLPKQWEHWCRDMKLKVHGRRFKKRRNDWLYLKGRGFYWRLNCHGEFERGDTLDDFDRWALCNIDRLPMPTTREEFRSAVRSLKAAFKEPTHGNR